ncbi:acyl-CoA dehydrogenase [Acidicapsa acidisoli]|uniref:acyl-CoA dehydrogenase n=1 Tax=Acidicapsa acidisoli TaxID=1615681 RepID=UPI0021DFBD03|nr:acyl-CoA dehydrogenase [Acidicapsa acidisoli]
MSSSQAESISKSAAARQSLTELSEDELLLQSSVRRFAAEVVAPQVRAMDEAQQFAPGLVAQLAELGLMGIEVPEELGGAGGSFFEAILAVEALSAVDASVGLVVDIQNTLCVNSFRRWGTDAQRRQWLPKLAGGMICSYALSEAGSGSDAFAMETRAVRTNAGYRLRGRKLWISNAREAGVFLVFANLNPEAGYRGITAFLVEAGTPGLAIGRKEDKLGIRASSTCEVILEDCEIPATNLFGEEGKGYKIAIEVLNEGRIGIGAQMLGLAQGAWNHAARYAQQRKQFGKAIAEFQAVQFSLAEMATEIEAARLMVYNAARRKDAGLAFVTEAAMTKYFVSQVAERVASQCVEIFGGNGYVRDYPAEKYFRDAKIGKIYEGTSNMQLMTIAKQLLSHPVSLQER